MTFTPPGGFQNPNQDLVLTGDIVIKDSSGIERIRLDHETGGIIVRNRSNEIVFRWEMPGNNLRFGGHNRDGDLVIFPRSATSLANVEQGTLHFNGDQGSLRLGGGEIPGQLVCLDSQGNQTIFLDGASGDVTIGANGQNGDLVLQNRNNESTVYISGGRGSMRLGGANQDGELFIRNTGNENTILLDGATNSITIRNDQGRNVVRLDADEPEGPGSEVKLARCQLGGNGNHGRLQMFPAESSQLDFNFSTAEIVGDNGTLSLGSGPSNVTGKIVIFDSEGSLNFQARGDGSVDAGSVFLNGSNNSQGIQLLGHTATIIVGAGSGAGNVAGNIDVLNNDGDTTVQIDGEAGDIILQNADCAEEFEVDLGIEIEPGTVMVLNESGNLISSQTSYDKRVVGIVAGAGKLRPGIVLGHHSDSVKRVPITLVGRTYCKVDANECPIAIGDLLTTSETPGHAMKATDTLLAFGAIIGKALEPVTTGTALIPVLVCLQ